MRKLKLWYITLGFIAAVAYLVACGSGSNSIADIIGKALDISYDNSTSGLSATNVQDAIDEVSVSYNQVLIESDLVGDWHGLIYQDQDSDKELTLTLVSDGTFSCDGFNQVNETLKQICEETIREWSVTKRTIVLDSRYEDGYNHFYYLPVSYFSKTSMEIQYTNSGRIYPIVLIKE